MVRFSKLMGDFQQRIEKAGGFFFRQYAQCLRLKLTDAIPHIVHHGRSLIGERQTLKPTVREIHLRCQQTTGNQLEHISGDRSFGHAAVQSYISGGVQVGSAGEKQKDADFRWGDLPVGGCFVQQPVQKP